MIQKHEAVDHLVLAATQGGLGRMREALAAGADVNALSFVVGPERCNALQMAVRGGHVEAVELLRAHGASFTPAQQPDLQLPVHALVPDGTTMLQKLVDEGLDLVGWRAWNRATLLHKVVEDQGDKEYTGRIPFLVGLGLNPNAADHLGRTPLHAAARLDAAARCLALVQCGAEVNMRDDDGLTPLATAIDAASTARKDAACMLVALGGWAPDAIWARSYAAAGLFARTPLECAVLTRRPEVVSWGLDHLKDFTAQHVKDALTLAQAEAPETAPLLRSWLAQDYARQAAAEASRDTEVRP